MIQILIHLANEESAIQLTWSDPPEKLKSTYSDCSLTDVLPIPEGGGCFSEAPCPALPPWEGTAPLHRYKERHPKQNHAGKQNLERMRQQLQSKYKMHLKVIICITTSHVFCCVLFFLFFFFSKLLYPGRCRTLLRIAEHLHFSSKVVTTLRTAHCLAGAALQSTLGPR